MRSEQNLYEMVEAIPGQTFGQYRRKLYRKRRELRQDWGLEHPVRSLLGWISALTIGGLCVFALPVFGFWIIVLFVTWLLVHEWRKVRRDRGEWRKALNRAAVRASEGPPGQRKEGPGWHQ